MFINNIFATPIYDSTVDTSICSEYSEQMLVSTVESYMGVAKILLINII